MRRVAGVYVEKEPWWKILEEMANGPALDVEFHSLMCLSQA